jgi:RNA-directed DNA polymerase
VSSYQVRVRSYAQQAVVEVEALVFRGHSEVVDADLTDYFGSPTVRSEQLRK